MQVLVVLVQRFITTVEKNTDVASQIVRWVAIVTVIWRFGTTYSHSLTVMAMVVTKSLLRRTSIQVWVLRDLQSLCRMLTQYLILIL